MEKESDTLSQPATASLLPVVHVTDCCPLPAHVHVDTTRETGHCDWRGHFVSASYLLVWCACVLALAAALAHGVGFGATKSGSGLPLDPSGDETEHANVAAVVPANTAARRSFVCITGQLERLELENKISTILEPLRRAGYEPDIALVLDDTTSFVTNDRQRQANGGETEFTQPFGTYGRAADHLRKRDFNVVTDDPYRQVAAPMVSEGYAKNLHRKGWMDDAEHLERAKNNIRMLESWSQCFSEMSKDTDRAISYDAVVRIREDSGFLEVPNWVEIIEQDLRTELNTIISNGCRFASHGELDSMNDKFAIVSKDDAYAYFVAPFHHLYARPIDERVRSSETFTYYTYAEEGLQVNHSEKIRNVVKLTSDQKGRTILYPEESAKLEEMCNIHVRHPEKRNACTSSVIPTWHGHGQRRLHKKTTETTCWPYRYKGSK